MRLVLVPLALLACVGAVKFYFWLQASPKVRPSLQRKKTISIARFPKHAATGLLSIPERTSIIASVHSCAELFQAFEELRLSSQADVIVLITEHAQPLSFDDAIRHLGGNVTHVPLTKGLGIRKVYFDEARNEISLS